MAAVANKKGNNCDRQASFKFTNKKKKYPSISHAMQSQAQDTNVSVDVDVRICICIYVDASATFWRGHVNGPGQRLQAATLVALDCYTYMT